MNQNEISRSCLAAAAAMLLAGCQPDSASLLGPETSSLQVSASAQGGRTTQRSIEEFIAAQGTFCAAQPDACLPIWAPLPELVVWYDGNSEKMAAVDYTGQAAAYLSSVSGGAISLGTTVDGSIMERVLNDGSVQIQVKLRTRNALTFVGSGEYVSGDPLYFGATPEQVLAGATPALATSFLKLTYVTTAPGLPLSDIAQIAFAPEPGQGALKVQFHVQANGVLHAASGFPEGTAGRLRVQQVGIFKTKSPSKAENPFVVERIELTAAGK
jgi:hypothetical protein